MICHLIVGEHAPKTLIRFRIFNVHEDFITVKDMDFDSEDCIFTGIFHKIDATVLLRFKNLKMVKELISYTKLLNMGEIFTTYERKNTVS